MHNTIAQWDYSQHVCLLSKSGSNLNPTQALYLRPIFLAQELLVSWSQHSIMSTNWSRIKNSLSFPGGFHICHVQVIHIDPDKVEAAQRLRLRWTPALSNAATHRLWSWQSQQASTMETGLWSRVEIAVRNSTYCINWVNSPNLLIVHEWVPMKLEINRNTLQSSVRNKGGYKAGLAFWPGSQIFWSLFHHDTKP